MRYPSMCYLPTSKHLNLYKGFISCHIKVASDKSKSVHHSRSQAIRYLNHLDINLVHVPFIEF